MASELSKFIDDELLREGNTGERSQLLNGGTFNVEKPGSRQARSNVFSKRNIACFVILIVVAGAVGTAIYHKDKAASKQPKPTPRIGPNKKRSQPPGKTTQASNAAIPAASSANTAQGVPKGKLPGTAKLPGKLPKTSRHQVPIAAGPMAEAPAEAPAAAPSPELAPAFQIPGDPRGRKLLQIRSRNQEG